MRLNQQIVFIVSLFNLAAGSAWAEGTLTHMSGQVSVQKADGKTLPGAAGLKVSAGDTVVTGAGGYVRMEMTDGGEMVLRPDSQLKVEGYKFIEAKPAEDSFVFSMLKGGLRTVSGLIGKRGNRDAYELRTQTATIGIRGTQFDLRVCQASCGALADGTYLAVRFGAVQTTNTQGSLAVAAGQVAYVPSQRPPVILPRDPGIGFTPPPVIPKLDEKKKLQAAATAAANPAPGTAPASGSGQGSSSNTQRSAPASSTTTEKTSSTATSSGSGTAPASTQESAKPEASGTSGGSSGGSTTNSSSPPAASTTSPAPGTDCSVQ